MLDKPKEYTSIGEIFAEFLIFDIRNPRIQEMLLLRCYNFLAIKLEREEDTELFIFDVKFDKSGDCIILKGENLISSLWIIGIFPKDPIRLVNSTIYTTDGKEYIYNSKNKKLTVLELYKNDR